MKKGRIFISMVAFLLLPAFASGAEAPGVTDKEVWIGLTGPLSGPAALWGTTPLAAKAWADHLNSIGDIHGRKIKVILKDDAYTPPRALANLHEMKGKVIAVVAPVGSAVQGAIKDFFFENKFPVIYPKGNPRIYEALPKEKLRYVFNTFTDYEDEAEFLTTYAINNLGTKKISVFYQNDEYGKGGLRGGESAIKKSSGKAELAATVPYELAERALGHHALKLKESGADTIIIYATPTHAALIAKEIAKVGYKPKILSSFTTGDPVMFKLAGEAWEGVYVGGAGHSGIPGVDPEADKVTEIVKKIEPKTADNPLMAVEGATSMEAAAEGLRNAGRELTVEKLIEGMEKIKGWKPMGLGAPVTFGPGVRHGVNASRILQVRGGKYVQIAPFTNFKPRF